MTPEEATRTVEALFDSWYSALVHYAARTLGKTSLAEDAVQETLLHLYRRLRSGGSIDNVRAWTLVVLRREIGRQVRQHRRVSPTVDMADLDSLPATLAGDTLSDDELARLLGALTRREEEAVLLRLEALKYREIADALGITVSSVNTLLARALRKLQRIVGRGPATRDKTRATATDQNEDPDDESRTLH